MTWLLRKLSNLLRRCRLFAVECMVYISKDLAGIRQPEDALGASQMHQQPRSIWLAMEMAIHCGCRVCACALEPWHQPYLQSITDTYPQYVLTIQIIRRCGLIRMNHFRWRPTTYQNPQLRQSCHVDLLYGGAAPLFENRII